jgi:release factor glutamine methyltransferase
VTVRGWLVSARLRLGPVAGGQADREARLILGHVTGWTAAQVATAGPEALSPAQAEAAETMLRRRLAREPLAQILGDWGFFGLSFRVTRDTLVPRPDTETLIEHALAAPFSRMIDLGTGSGAIAVTLLAERTEAEGLATDISPAALEVAAENAARHGVDGRLRLQRADWWAGVEGRFDLVVSNPPYVSEAEYATLDPEITLWEPRGALTPGGDGLAAYRAILAGVGAHLVPGGRCLVEIGAGQGAAVAALFREAGLDMVTVHPDIDGRPRVVVGAMPKRHAHG